MGIYIKCWWCKGEYPKSESELVYVENAGKEVNLCNECSEGLE